MLLRLRMTDFKRRCINSLEYQLLPVNRRFDNSLQLFGNLSTGVQQILFCDREMQNLECVVKSVCFFLGNMEPLKKMNAAVLVPVLQTSWGIHGMHVHFCRFIDICHWKTVLRAVEVRFLRIQIQQQSVRHDFWQKVLLEIDWHGQATMDALWLCSCVDRWCHHKSRK